jgi:hypothetical protein
MAEVLHAAMTEAAIAATAAHIGSSKSKLWRSG